VNYVYANVDRTIIEDEETFDLDGANAHIFQMRFAVNF
jgi:hypothetical protein